MRTEPGTAVVTGAGSGLGRVISRALLDDGWRVALAGRREDALRETAAESEGALVVPTDVADADAVAALFGAATDAWGRLDLLVNNAGMTGPVGTPDQVDVDGWQATVGVNLTGSFLCAREAFAIMRAQEPQGGRIVNNGSIAAHTGRPGGIAYTSTKHAITGLTKSIALDGRPFGIACGQFDVGNAATDMTARMREGIVQPNGERMVEPTFDPVHVADAVRYMVGLPLDANVPFLTVMATTMPYLGRG
ncbi:SDR family oxidoreductase [Actinomycetospora endophytica]|uniref:SDR family oxidoreductase n=1 Tax=Actinomycetospora endophytica TaxID=2291215 RepID=A0ABS8P877_9PSEU|nr:SDR family oxidoreductase [Actinomycetospora endophytica]MCD2193730.1 SDR family oxidoreductase [Actinomycetospora endophytica]